MNPIRFLMILSLITSLFCSSSSYIMAQQELAPSMEPAEVELRDQVAESRSRLGELEVWQKTLFEDEVIPQYRRFIKEYRAGPEGVKVTIDDESLRRFLAFYAPTYFQKPKPKILVLLKTDQSCEVCKKAITPLEKQVKERLEKRGFEVHFKTSSEVKFQNNPRTLQVQLTESMKTRSMEASLLVLWGGAQADATESPHIGEENRYVLWTLLHIGDQPMLSRQQEILDGDAFYSTETRILTDLFTELGSKTGKTLWEAQIPGVVFNSADPIEAIANKKEILIQVSGIESFSQYQRIKDRLQTDLKDVATIEPRKFSAGRASFALDSKMEINELTKRAELSEKGIGSNEDSQIKIKVGVE